MHMTYRSAGSADVRALGGNTVNEAEPKSTLRPKVLASEKVSGRVALVTGGTRGYRRSDLS